MLSTEKVHPIKKDDVADEKSVRQPALKTERGSESSTQC